MSGKQHVKKADKRILLTWFAMGIVPVIVMLMVGDNTLMGCEWFSSTDTEADFFLIYKMYALIITMAAMAAIVCADIYNGRNNALLAERIKSSKVMVAAAGLYCVLALVSSFLADETDVAFKGGYAQHEPVWVLMSYIVILLFTYCYINNSSTLLFLYRMFVAACGVISLLGVLQFMQMDFFNSAVGRRLVTMFSGIDPERISLKFEPGRVYMTLYNPNYVGSYVALVLPFVAVGIFMLGKTWERVACGVISLMLVLCLVGSWSTTGMTAVVVSTALLFVVVFIAMAGNRKKFITAAAATCVIVAVAALINMDRIGEALGKYRMTKDDFAITGMELQDDCVMLEYMGSNIYIRCNLDEGSGVLEVCDNDGNPLELAYDEAAGGIVVTGESEGVSDGGMYSGLVFGAESLDDGKRGFFVRYGALAYVFTNDNEEGRYYYCNPYGRYVDDVVNSDGVLFGDYEQFASGRGLIWSRSIALLKDNILFGCGPDNFVYEFPNNDYVSLLNNGYYKQVVTRPHNMYLQTGVQTGALSLVLFILIYVIYFIQSIRIYSKKSGMTEIWFAGVAIMAGTFGYMVCGIANDSTVCVAPVFWGMLGMGYACNYMMASTDGEGGTGTKRGQVINREKYLKR